MGGHFLWVSGSGWRYILGEWRWVEIFMGGWGWVEVYFGWLGVGRHFLRVGGAIFWVGGDGHSF